MANPHFLRSLFLKSFIVAVFVSAHSTAQVMPQQFDQRTGQFVEPSRTIRQVLRDGEQAAKDKRWGEVVLLIGELLSRPTGIDPDDPRGGEDFFLDATNNSTLRSESLRRSAEKLLGAMPNDGLQTYRLRYGPEAERMLKKSAETRDWETLAEISRRYLHTESGYQATMLLAGRELSRGKPIAAALILERLHEHPAARSYLGEALPKTLTYAWRLANNSDRAAKLSQTDVPSSDDLNSLTKTWVRRLSHPDTAVSGGGAERAGDGGGALPLVHPKWKSFLASDPQEEAILESLNSQQISSNAPAIPSWRPLVAGRYVLARNTERLVGIDLQDGNQVWHFPYGDNDPGFQGDEGSLSSFGEEDDLGLLKQRIWQDVPYGQVSSDGKLAFMLDELVPMQPTVLGGMGGLGAFNMRRGARPRDQATCALVAVDLTTEGKLVWSISGRDTEDGGLQGAFFLGPPLPIKGKLYSIAEIGGDTYLLCLAAQTGALLWRQHLTTSESGSLANEPMRRMIGAVPSMSNGVLVCPTGQGTVVAMDLETRSLRWALSLPRMRNGYSTTQRSNAPDGEQTNERWLDGTPVIAEGLVLLTPPECDELYCVDLVSGELRFPKMQRDDWWCVAGVRNGRFLLLGDKGLAAFDLRTGGRAWPKEAKFPDGHRAAGRGVYGENSYIVGTTGGELLEFSLEDGKQLGRVKVDYPVGNLLAAGDSMIVQGVKEIGASYFGGESLRATIEARLSVNPMDCWALTRKGEAAIESKNLKEAIEWLRQARQIDPNNEEVRMLLVESMLGVVREDKAAAEQWIDELEQLADLPEERIELLRVLTERSIQNKDYATAISRVAKLSESITNNVQSLGGVGKSIESGDRLMAIDGWIAARVDEVKREITTETLANIRQPIIEQLENSKELAIPLKTRLLKQYGSLAISDALRISLVKHWINEGDLFVAERTLLDAIERSKQGDSVRTWELMLARVYAEAGWRADALAALARGEVAGSIATTEELAGASREAMLEMLEKNQDLIKETNWPKYVHVTTRPDRAMVGAETDLLEVVIRRSKNWENWRVGESGGALRLIDPMGQMQTHIDLGQNKLPKSYSRCMIDGGLLLILTPTEIVAIDLFTVLQAPEVLWRKPIVLGSQTATIPEPRLLGRNQREMLVATTQAPIMRLAGLQGRKAFAYIGGRMVGLDIMDGTEMWSFSPEKTTLSGNNARSMWPLSFADNWAVVASQSDHWWSIDTNDGTVLETHSWPTKGGVLETHGSHVLWVNPKSKDGELPTVGLDDLATGKTLLSQPCAFWNSSDRRWQILSQSDGTIHVWDLEQGKLIVDTKLEIKSPLETVAALRHGNAIVLLTSNGSVQQRVNPYGEHVNGPVAAYSLMDGKQLWQANVDETFGCMMNQLIAWPLLIFSRDLPKDISGRQMGEVLAIDVRNGQEVARINLLPMNPAATLPSVELNPNEAVGSVHFGASTLEFKFSDTPPDKSADKSSGKGDESGKKPSENPFGLFE